MAYELGDGADQSFWMAAMQYREACEDNYGEACARLAAFYEKGSGVQKSADKANDYRKQACTAGYAPACDKPKATS